MTIFEADLGTNISLQEYRFETIHQFSQISELLHLHIAVLLAFLAIYGLDKLFPRM